ncbi:Uncharacterised protein [Mycobacteroides abscessus subsp. abscessus]|nr:Uncharacterised protein [Mycobacteroides abscessus subsp. abscessus]
MVVYGADKGVAVGEMFVEVPLCHTRGAADRADGDGGPGAQAQ